MDEQDATVWRRTIAALIMSAIPVAVPLDNEGRKMRLVGTRFVIVICEESPHEGWSLVRRGET